MTALDRQQGVEARSASLVGARAFGAPASQCAAAVRAALRRRWSAIIFATLLAFLCQSFVTQTHVHVDPVGRSAMLSAPWGGLTAQKTDPSSPDLPPCPICREIAHAGAYLPPATVAIQAPTPDAAWRVILPIAAPTRRQLSHDWRSRAPPTLLHA